MTQKPKDYLAILKEVENNLRSIRKEDVEVLNEEEAKRFRAALGELTGRVDELRKKASEARSKGLTENEINYAIESSRRVVEGSGEGFEPYKRTRK